MVPGTQNAFGHTVASLTLKPRRYASLGFRKVLLTRAPWQPTPEQKPGNTFRL